MYSENYCYSFLLEQNVYLHLEPENRRLGTLFIFIFILQISSRND